ncbi:MAG TPA: cupredoxin domain-containing protein [Conexibacter sp.]
MFGLLRRGAALAAITATAAVLLAGCGSDVKGGHADLVKGKQLFVQRCGACHTLARAGTRGTVGPDLDAAFTQSLGEGFERSVVRGVVEAQVLHPRVSSQMPAQLVGGQRAVDVAAYVAYAAARPGDDTGALAVAVRAVAQRTATAQGGKLEIDANPDGQLAYQVSSATAPTGALEIDSRNASGTPHDIALEEGGRQLGKGEVVSSGGVSRLAVTLRPGRYTFYCTVPGHREGGMEGTLTVR